MHDAEKRKIEYRLKNLKKILQELRETWVFVEGKKDKEALAKFKIKNVLTISGNLRISCNKVKDVTENVIILTDLDRRGNELAIRAREELERYSVKADTETRKHLAGILDLRCFEDMERKHVKFMEKIER